MNSDEYEHLREEMSGIRDAICAGKKPRSMHSIQAEEIEQYKDLCVYLVWKAQSLFKMIDAIPVKDGILDHRATEIDID